MISYSVSRRTHEIGLRMALGAGESDVLRLVVRQGMRVALAGAAAGLLGALLLTRLMSTLLYGVRSTDPATFLVVTLVLAGVAVVASYSRPPRRANRPACRATPRLGKKSQVSGFKSQEKRSIPVPET